MIDYLKLCRVSNLPTVWTNVLAAMVLSLRDFSWFDFFILALSMSFFYSGGMCLNDIIDEPIDTLKKPFRPIPSGRVSLKYAYRFTIALFVAGFAFLLIVPYQRAVYAALFLLAFIIAYDTFHKTHPASIFLMAACRLMVFVITAVAVTGKTGSLVIIAGFIQSLYILSISLAAHYENNRPAPFIFPVIPIMIACISLLDGVMMAVFESPEWLAAGIIGFALTVIGQRYIRGD